MTTQWVIHIDRQLADEPHETVAIVGPFDEFDAATHALAAAGWTAYDAVREPEAWYRGHRPGREWATITALHDSVPEAG